MGQPAGVQRYRRLNKLLAQKEIHDFDSLARILRDHYEDELIAPRFGATVGVFRSVCMHMYDFGSSETSAALLSRFDSELGVIARYAPAQPCLSAFIPVYMTDLPKRMQTADRTFDPDTLWWQVKRLSLLVAVDEERFGAAVREKLSALEEKFKRMAEDAEDAARAALRAGDAEKSKNILASLTADCTEQLYALARAECARLGDEITALGGLYGRQKEELEAYAAYAQIDYFA